MMKEKKPPTTRPKKYTNVQMLLSMIMTVLITRTFDQTHQIQGLTPQKECTCNCAVSEQIVSIPAG